MDETKIPLEPVITVYNLIHVITTFTQIQFSFMYTSLNAFKSNSGVFLDH